MNKPIFSIIIPTKNEEKNIGLCLNAVFNQEFEGELEIIVIDSGSSDKTLEIIKTFNTVKLIEIEPKNFGHGKTRNYGASLAKGDYLVFLNADAIPSDNNWLNELFSGFASGKDIAGAFSRHLPKDGCNLYMERDLLRSTPNKSKIISKRNSLDFMLFSTVSCLIPKSLWERYKFKEDIGIAEDQEWATGVLQNGLNIFYSSESKVYHSHNYSFKELYNNKLQVAKESNYFKNRFKTIVFGAFLSIGGFIYKITGDFFYIMFSKKSIRLSVKTREIIIAFKSRVASFLGKYIGWFG